MFTKLFINYRTSKITRKISNSMLQVQDQGDKMTQLELSMKQL